MGLAASQARLLTLTSRKSDVEARLMSIANEKMALSRDSSKVSEDYSNALASKKLTWDVTNGTTTPLTYDLLMTQNDLNSSGQYFISDSCGRVMLDTELAKKMGATGSCGSGAPIAEDAFLQKVMPDNVTSADVAQKYIDNYDGVTKNGSEVSTTTMGTDMAKVLSYVVDNTSTKTYNDGQLEGFKSALDTASSDIDTEIKALTGIKSSDSIDYAALTYGPTGSGDGSLNSDTIRGALGCDMTTVTKNASGTVLSTQTNVDHSVQVATTISGGGASIDGNSASFPMAAAKNIKSITDKLDGSVSGANYDPDHESTYGTCEDNAPGVQHQTHYNVAGTRTITYNDGTASTTGNIVYVFSNRSTGCNTTAGGQYSGLVEILDYGSTPVHINEYETQRCGSGFWDKNINAEVGTIVNSSGNLVTQLSATKFTTTDGATTTAKTNYDSNGNVVSTVSQTYNPDGYSAKYIELEYLVRMQRGIQAIQQLLKLYTQNPSPEAVKILTTAITLVLQGGTSKDTGGDPYFEPESLLADGNDSANSGTTNYIDGDGGNYANFLDYNQTGAWKNTSMGASVYNYSKGTSSFREDLTDLMSNYKTVRTNREEDDTSTTLPNVSTATYYLNLWNAMATQGWVLNTDLDDDKNGKKLQNMILNGTAYIYQHQDDGSWALTSSSDTDTPLNEETDNSAATAAEAEYNTRKDRLDYKESILDTQSSNLDTERTAITTEMESVQKVIDSNVKNFKIFDA